MARKQEPTSEEARAIGCSSGCARPSPGSSTPRPATRTSSPSTSSPPSSGCMDLVEEPVPTPEQLTRWRDEGERLARSGAATERVLDGYLSLNWAIWEAVMRQEDIPRAVVLEFADRLLRGLDDAIAAISQGYIRVEVEVAAAHSERAASRAGGPALGASHHAPGPGPHPPAERATWPAARGPATGSCSSTCQRQTTPRSRTPSTSSKAASACRPPLTAPGPASACRSCSTGVVACSSSPGADWTGEQAPAEGAAGRAGRGHRGHRHGPRRGRGGAGRGTDAGRVQRDRGRAALGRRGWIGDPGELALETTFLLDRAAGAGGGGQ